MRSPLRSALRAVRDFRGSGAPCSAPRSATTASADFSLRPTAASPFQAQGETSPGKSRGLRCTIAAFTPSAFGREGFAATCPLALTRSALYAVSVRRPTASAPRFFRPRPHDLRLAVRSGFLRPSTPEDLHLLVTPMLGTQSKRGETQPGSPLSLEVFTRGQNELYMQGLPSCDVRVPQPCVCGQCVASLPTL
jgi:hypothetical protein